MILRILGFVKKLIFSALFIYSFDVFSSSLNFCIPINFFTLILVCFFDVPAIICLVFFYVAF